MIVDEWGANPSGMETSGFALRPGFRERAWCASVSVHERVRVERERLRCERERVPGLRTNSALGDFSWLALGSLGT